MKKSWIPRLMAVLVALMGVINLLSAETPALAERMALLRQISPLEVRFGGHLAAALAGFALLLLAYSLARRKQVAWMLTLVALGISAASHLLKGLDYEEALLAVALMIALWRTHSHFHARSDPPSVRQGLQVLGAAALFTLVYGVTGFYLLDRHYSVNFGLWAALRQTVVMFTQFYDPGLLPVTRFGRFFADSIYVVGAVTFAYAGFMLLRPVFLHSPATAVERNAARAIVEQYGRSSLARYLLFDDKRYFFSPGGSVIGYALAGRAAVSLGDPIGPRQDVLPAVEVFTALCRRNDWLPVLYQTQPDTLDLYRSAGFDALCVGHEAIVDLAAFTLEGKESKPLRAPVNKLTKAGYRFSVHEPPIADPVLDELRAVSDEWLTTMHGSEQKFSLGWFEDSYIRSCPIAAVYTPAGDICAFANLVSEYQRNEISIDLMRRRRDIENGTMEFLFVSLFQWAKAQGYATCNLGLSALAGVGEGADDPTIDKLMHWIYETIDQFYNFKGLHAFKDKFRPQWSPRYLIYPSATNLAMAWVAVVQANSGDNNLVAAYLNRLRKSGAHDEERSASSPKTPASAP